MTDRLKGCLVAFDRDIREDDAQEIINAIKMIKGVFEVTGEISNPGDWAVKQQIKSELKLQLLETFNKF